MASTSRARRSCSPRRRSSTASRRRDLLPWELAQIAGRAGRFGLVERGHVGVLAGVSWASANPASWRRRSQPHVRSPRAPRLPHRRRSADSAATLRPRGRRPAPAGRRAGCMAPCRDTRLGLRELARSRVAAADPWQARRDPASPPRAQPEALDRGHVEADQCAGGRGQRRAARDARARRRR